MDFVIRPLTAADEPLLWEMLFHGLPRSGEESDPSRETTRQPEFARYVEGWGRAGDAGFLAQDPESGELLGAVWFRTPAAETTPELAFAVAPTQRRRGIGAALLTNWVRANPEQSVVSLRVAPDNPAVRLYQRFGFRIFAQSGNSVTMQREG